jgi:hypothetical protein
VRQRAGKRQRGRHRGIESENKTEGRGKGYTEKIKRYKE